MLPPKLKDSKKRAGADLYPIGEFPYEVIYEISKWIVYNFAVGKSDISGEDWGDIFAKALVGKHLSSPVGLADVVSEGKAWSVKSVKHDKPHLCEKIRVISGRNSPDYSYGIQNPHDDPQKTGTAVLGIWNERINIALDRFDSLRTVIFIREVNRLEFTLFETETYRFPTNEYVWHINSDGNLEGVNKTTNIHKFSWQPHGSQFTIMYSVPASSVRFKVKRPAVLDFEKTIEQIGFDKSWITINP
jgi:hypothetical protein